MTMNSKYLHEIRQECHESVFQAVKSCPHGALNVIREPYQALQPSCKAIVVLSDIEQATALKTDINSIVERANSKLSAEIKGSSYPRYEINYNIKLVYADGDVILTERTAEKRRKLSGKNLCGTLAKIITQLDPTDRETAERIETFMKTLIDENSYTFSVQTGKSYRVTYFDRNTQNRQQCNVGNVLIVVGSGRVKTPEQRKQRSDKKSHIFTASCKYIGQIAVYSND